VLAAEIAQGLRDQLNPLDADGWELVSIFFESIEGTTHQRTAVAYLKRAK